VDLFSGIGGFALACEWAGVKTIAFAEIDPYASKVLQRHWPNVKNYGDVRNVPAIGSVWLVSGGVPCQPASVAGKRRGAADDRWLWPEALAVAERVQPAWVLFENPCGILSLNNGLEFERICTALEGQGYEVQSLVIPACAVGAIHRRDRVWIIAYADSQWKLQREGDVVDQWRRDSNSIKATCSNSQCNRLQGQLRQNSTHATGTLKTLSASELPVSRIEQLPQPYCIGSLNGIPNGAHRIRKLGNAIVPQVAYQLIKRMIEAEEQL
jgi:DNA (cytosine-5)-methyltransferase 1